MENNLAANTQIGRIIIEDPDNPNRKYSLNEHPDMFSNDDEEAKYTRGGEFLANYISNNILEFSRRWMGLGDIFDIEEDIREFYKFNKYSGPSIEYQFNEAAYEINSNKIQAVTFNDGLYSPEPAILFDNHFDENLSEGIIEDIKKGAIL